MYRAKAKQCEVDLSPPYNAEVKCMPALHCKSSGR